VFTSVGTVDQFFDTVTVLSSSLPAGTPVDLAVTPHLDGTAAVSDTTVGLAGGELFIAWTGSTGATCGVSVGNGALFGGGLDGSGRCGTFPITIHTSVGSSLVLNSSIDVRVQLDPSAAVPAVNGTANFIGTAFVILTPPSGVTLSSAAGTDYSTPPVTTPEPSTWLLLGSGLAGLAAWRRKKAA
jgi:hypothetical protein